MIIVIPTNNNNIDNGICPSFGRSPFYLIFDDSNDEYHFVVNEAANSQGGAGIRAAQFIVDNKADVVLTPRCGENSANVLLAANIGMYKTISDSIQENITLFKEGKLASLSDIHAGYHSHKGN